MTARLAPALSRLAGNGLARPLRRAVDLLLGGRPRVVRVVGGVARGARLELDLAREKAYWLGHYEPVVQELLRAHVRPGDLAYDVGGHLGFFSIGMARLGARVVVFEPSPENARRLRRNVELNGLPVEVVEAAVWQDEGGASLAGGASSAEWTVVPGAGAGGGGVAGGAGGAGVVRTVTLDGFLARGDAPAFVKIDAEGAELEVLRGAAALLVQARPVIVCEIHSAEARAAIAALLPGYRLEEAGSPWRIVAFPLPV